MSCLPVLSNDEELAVHLVLYIMPNLHVIVVNHDASPICFLVSRRYLSFEGELLCVYPGSQTPFFIHLEYVWLRKLIVEMLLESLLEVF